MSAPRVNSDQIDLANRRVDALVEGLSVERWAIDGGVALRADGQILQARLDYLSADRAFLWFVVHTTSWEFAGERTDLHDVLSLTVVALLAATGEASCQLIDEVNPALRGFEDEIYARLLVPVQPGPVVDLERPERLRRLLEAAWSLEATMWEQLHYPEDCPCEEGMGKPLLDAEALWVEKVLGAVRRKPSKRNFASRRAWPEWQYVHGPQSALTVVFAPQLADLLALADPNEERSIEEMEEGRFMRTGEVCNLIAPAVVRRARHVLGRLRDLRDDEEPRLFPLEDRVIASGLRHVISLPADSGGAAYREGWDRVEQRARQQLSFFGVHRAFVWADHIPPDRFEDLVAELLERTDEVAWIRQVGATNERDRERDFIAEWVTATSAESVPQGASPQVRVPVVVQCKASGRTVNKGDVPSILEVVEEHDAGGYFLAVASQLSAPLVDRLSALRQRKRFEVVDWWGRREIERELRGSPDVLTRYADVVRPADVVDDLSAS